MYRCTAKTIYCSSSDWPWYGYLDGCCEQQLHTNKNLLQKTFIIQYSGSSKSCLASILIVASSSSGASSDLEQATKLARNMVTKYGMSEKVGNISIDYEDDGRSLSSETRSAVEEEVCSSCAFACLSRCLFICFSTLVKWS